MVQHLLPQTQALRLVTIGIFALFLGWLILSLVVEGRKPDGGPLGTVVQDNNTLIGICALLLCLSLGISLWADADQSNVVHSTALYTTMGCWFSWIIFALGDIVDIFKDREIATTSADFYKNSLKTEGAFAVIAFALLFFLMIHAMMQSCTRSPDERPQFQKFSIVCIIFIVLGLFLFAAASIAVENENTGSNTLGIAFVVYGALFLLAFIPSATVRGGGLTNMIAFWLTFMIAIVGWSCLIYVGRVSADSDFGTCGGNTQSTACNIYGLQAAASIIITVSETLLCIFIWMYSRDGAGSSSSSGQSSG